MDRNGWRKSSYSGNGGSACVQVKPGARIGLRDTKDRARGQLSVSVSAWRGLVSYTRGADASV